MSEPPTPSQKRFDRLVHELSKEAPNDSPRRDGFGSGSLFVGRKLFGLLGSTGALIVKLPPLRVAELIASGIGTPWHPGTGKPLKEYVAIAYARQRDWSRFAKEARAYIASMSK
jgi:hypothetical protein